ATDRARSRSPRSAVIRALAERLDALERTATPEPSAVAALGRDIAAAAEQLDSVELKTRIKRLVYASVSAGDLAGLDEGLRQLDAAEPR
ncbi:hypothetical protein L6R52_22865, partial [Myxococcota bacterium]|nr:hypothetical protein [Myxococcota bacterium]